MVSKFWWAITIIVIGDILGVTFTISQGIKVPIWIWILITATVLSLAQFEAFHQMRLGVCPSNSFSQAREV